MKKMIKIEGMSCGNCVRCVTGALGNVPGVGGVQVSLQEKSVLIEVSEAVKDESLVNAINEAGYDVIEVNGLKSDTGRGGC